MEKYLFALAGDEVCAVVGIAMPDDPQVGAGLGGAIGAGFGLTYGMLRERA